MESRIRAEGCLICIYAAKRAKRLPGAVITVMALDKFHFKKCIYIFFLSTKVDFQSARRISNRYCVIEAFAV